MMTRADLEKIIETDQQDLKESYAFRKRELRGAANEHSFFLDKALLTISTGAIFLLFSFSDKLSTIFGPNSLIGLKVIMTLLSIVIIAIILSFIFAGSHFSESSVRIDSWYVKNHDTLNKALRASRMEDLRGAVESFETTPDTDTTYARVATCFNYIAYSLTIISLIIAIFIIWFIAV